LQDSLPRFQEKNKMIVGLRQFPMTFIAMIVHGHGDKTLVQYSNKFQTNDPIELQLHLLRALEMEPICK
jgi:hypothetical protein